jgi:hypothetical protein
VGFNGDAADQRGPRGKSGHPGLWRRSGARPCGSPPCAAAPAQNAEGISALTSWGIRGSP